MTTPVDWEVNAHYPRYPRSGGINISKGLTAKRDSS